MNAFRAWVENVGDFDKAFTLERCKSRRVEQFCYRSAAENDGTERFAAVGAIVVVGKHWAAGEMMLIGDEKVGIC